MARRRILITGSSGQLGRALVRVLGAEHDIVQLDVRPQTDTDLANVGPVHVGSVGDRAVVSRAMEGVDTVIHAGAIPWNVQPFDELVRTDFFGTVNMLEEAGARKHVERFVFISTVRVHGVLEAVRRRFMPRFLPFDETHPYLTAEYYAASKLQAERRCREYVKRFRKPVVVIRPPFILGAQREPTFSAAPAPDVPSLIQYVATSDLVDGITRAMDYDPESGFDRFLFHADDQCTTTPTLDYVARHFPGIGLDRDKLARCEGFGALVDCTHAHENLGWNPQFRCRRT